MTYRVREGKAALNAGFRVVLTREMSGLSCTGVRNELKEAFYVLWQLGADGSKSGSDKTLSSILFYLAMRRRISGNLKSGIA
jgi:hypothetical protein